MKSIKKFILKNIMIFAFLLAAVMFFLVVNSLNPQAVQNLQPEDHNASTEGSSISEEGAVVSPETNQGSENISGQAVYMESITVNSEEQLLSALQAAKTVVLESDIQLSLGPLMFNKDTVLDGKGFTIQQSAKNERVAEIAPGVSVTMSNIKITGGNIRDFGSESTYGFGGGILNHGTLSLNKVTVDGNSAYEGAGIYNAYEASLTLTDVNVSNNVSDGFGGGISNNGNIEIDNSVIQNNKSFSGGGIYNLREAKLTARNMKVLSNESLNAYQGGGGIFNGGSLWLSQSQVYDNKSASDGGGILNYGQFTLEKSMIRGNVSSKNGGGIFTGSLNNVNVFLSSVIENEANMGGGIFNDYAKTINVTNCTISKNKSQLGGGVYNCGDVSMVYCTVSFNQSKILAGGVYNQSKIFSSKNSIIAYNETSLENLQLSSEDSDTKIVYKNDDIVSIGGYTLGDNNIYGNGANIQGDNNLKYRYSEFNSIFETNLKSPFNPELTFEGELVAYLPLSHNSVAINMASPIDVIGIDQLESSRGSAPSVGAVQASGNPIDVTNIALSFPRKDQTVIGDPVIVSMSVQSNSYSSPKGILTLFVNGRPRKINYISKPYQICRAKISNLGVGYHNFYAEFIPTGDYMYTNTDKIAYMVQKAEVILSDKLDLHESNGAQLLEYNAKLLPASLKNKIPSGNIILSYGSRNIEIPLDETGSINAKLHKSDVINNQNQITVTYEGDRYFLPFQTIASFTESTDSLNEVSKIDGSPVVN